MTLLQKSIESQKAILALLLHNPELYPEVSKLRSEMFVDKPQPFSKIFEGLVKLIQQKIKPTIVLLAKACELPESYLNNFKDIEVDLENVGLYVESVYNTWIELEQATFTQKVKTADNPVQAAKQLIADYEEKVERTVNKAHIIDHIARYLDHVEVIKTLPLEERLIKSPYPSLNNAIRGFYIANLSIIAGRPAMGKTALLRAIRDHVIWQYGKHALSFILEMSPHRLIDREIATRMGLPVADVIELTFQNNPAKIAEFYEITKKITGGDWHIYSSEIDTIEEIEAIIDQHAANDPLLAWIDVDYLQLLYTQRPTNNRNGEIGMISNRLAKIASRRWANRKSPQLHICVTAQLNRGVEQRDDKRPRLSDLRDSGEIEQAADLVILVYRDEVYYEDSPKSGIMELDVAKHRSGQANVVAEIQWRGSTMSFEDNKLWD